VFFFDFRRVFLGNYFYEFIWCKDRIELPIEKRENFGWEIFLGKRIRSFGFLPTKKVDLMKATESKARSELTNRI